MTRRRRCTSRSTSASTCTRSTEGFTDHARWDFENTPEDHYPLLLHYPYFQLYRKQVVKQADLVLAMYLRGDAFTPEEKARNFAYYEPLTVRDSSLSACTQAVIAAEVGQLDLAHDYLAEAALMDLQRRRAQHPRRRAHGVAGRRLDRAGGRVRRHAGRDGSLAFTPRLPGGSRELRFRLRYRGRRLRRDDHLGPRQVRAARRRAAARDAPRQGVRAGQEGRGAEHPAR